MSLPTKPTATMEDLPAEMICELFQYLCLKDLAACSMVNRRWHSLYTDFKLSRLIVVTGEEFRQYHLSEWHSKRKIEENELFHPKTLSGLTEQPLLSNLKYLALCGGSPEFDLNKLNAFSQLVQLEFGINELSKKAVHWNFPKLQILAFNQIIRYPLSIDCPKLSVLRYVDSGANHMASKLHLKLKHPETIRTLDTNLFGPKLAQFKNVECLVTCDFQGMCETTLLSLPKLKELRYPHYPDHFLVGRVKATLSKFMNDAKRLRGSDFQFSFAGVQLAKTNLDAIDFGEQVDGLSGRVSSEYVYMKNYQLIDPVASLDFVRSVSYTCLMRFAGEEIPGCFFNKFPGIRSVRTDGAIQDANHFLCFLKSASSLESLNLYRPQLVQEFYDQLPAAAPRLKDLQLQLERDDKLQSNFDFITKFPGLTCFDIFQTMPFGLRKRRFGYDSCIKPIRICIDKKSDSKVFKVFKGQELCMYKLALKTENFDKVVNYLQKIQNVHRKEATNLLPFESKVLL